MKTVGFLRMLQLSPEPKLTMPLTSQEPFSAWQFSGPPESPCTRPGGDQLPDFPLRQAWEARKCVWGALSLGTPVLASGFHGKGGRDDVVWGCLGLMLGGPGV